MLQHKRTCRRLLKHLPMIDNGEVEVDSLLVHNTKIMYKCSAVSLLLVTPAVLLSWLQCLHSMMGQETTWLKLA